MSNPFHLSLPCLRIDKTKRFYLNDLCADAGRQSENWIDINLYGNQITFVNVKKFNFNNPNYVFEGKILPTFHFGVILNVKTWGELYADLNAKNLDLVTQATFLKNKDGEHLSFFIKDPNDYLIEFKSFKNDSGVFSSKIA
ncbi:bleomycin resistance protein [Flavobacteriaceae bacterium F08102]|nr:bleomycin resistance protein [Flavobacteriaceae bacterium F08102]